MFTTFYYIDPAATSVLITSITAIVAAVGSFIVIGFRKAKKKVQKTFNIDENSKKEVEDELVIIEDNTSSEQESVDNDNQ